MIFEIRMRTFSRLNARLHWRDRWKQSKDERETAFLLSREAFGRKRPELPARVIMTRVSPRPLDDDNLRGALKSIRDGIADFLVVNDRDPRVSWEYDQKTGPRFSVFVEVTKR